VRVVVDTNVLVAGMLSPFGPCGQIVRLVSTDEVSLLLDARILTEYREVLSRPKFSFDPAAVAAVLDYIEYRGETVAGVPLRIPLPDVDDEAFLEVALAGSAEAFVTGNSVHFPRKARAGVDVLTPAEFVELFRQRLGEVPIDAAKARIRPR
jgi:putative PIN family toxin of toxin-antitoxin system